MNLAEFRAFLARLASFSIVLTASLGLATSVSYAQEGDDEAGAADVPEEGVPDRRIADEVVVTGSRLKRDTFTSISPLQIITGQISREVGLIDASKILQESSVAAGVQEDLTFSGISRTDNGPGSNTINLRGLGDSRTLILINGRRVAPAGVEGAPRSPDANLIPGSLVQQYEVLLDGASSIYGSDAVAGVINVILRKDFDGLELEGFTNVPAAGNSNGIQNTFRVGWGKNFDRGFVGFGAEHRTVDPITLDDRDWTKGCYTHAEITTEGEIRTRDVYVEQVLGQKSVGDCRFTGSANFMIPGLPGFAGQLGTPLATPGRTNIGIPGWSAYRVFSTNVDTDGDGVTDANFADINWNGNTQYAQLIPDLETTVAMAYGEYTFAGEANLTPYFEFGFGNRKSKNLGGPGNIGVDVPALNPFNICNPAAVGGVDCGLAYNTLLDDPNYAADFAVVQGLTPAQFRDFGIVDIYSPPLGAQPITTVISVRGDRDNEQTDLDQYRAIVGLRGDMPFMNFGSFEDWSFDMYISDSESDGDASRLGIREDRLNLAMGNFSTTGTPCVNDVGAELVSDAAPGCVPVDIFAPSLYANVAQNDFATPGERAYLFDSRDFRTKYRQTIGYFFMNGEIFEMQGGEALFGIGIEYREDEIESLPDEVAAEGLFPQFFVDGGAVGEKFTREAFAELELPILAGKKAVQELTLNASTRWTDDEFYGGAWTYSTKLAYRPVNSLVLKGTVGTSYRAPNLRENFLAGQSGFIDVADPCVVPPGAFDPINGYDPSADNREPEVIANCQADPNVDPFTFDNNGFTFYAVEAVEGGAFDLAEEKSDAWSASMAWEQPWFASFDMLLSATYFEIDVRDEIIEPSAGFIVADCYGDQQGDSGFCSRITRDPVTSQITQVDEGFINRDQRRARGVDLNMRMEWPTQMFNRAVDLSADFYFTRNLELSTRLIAGVDADEVETFEGEPAFPEWNGRMSLRAAVGDWRITWSTRYISSVNQDPDGVDPFDNIFDGVADTCLGPENGDVNCRDIGFLENYFTHDMSVYWFGDSWTVGAGVRNLTNQAPPFVDGTEVLSVNNAPVSSGYDLFGRTAFLNLEYNWQ